MKYTITKGIFLLLFFSLTISSYTDGRKDFKKTIKKEFDITKDGEVNISNKFGKVEINTWDKNKVKIEVTVIVRADSEKEADPVFDRISIHFSNGKDFVTAETEIASNKSTSWWGWNSSNNGSDFSINYEVFLPKSIALDLSNQHGESIIAELTGNATIDIAHGEISAEGFMGELELDIAHSDGTIGNINEMEADLAHSNIRFKTIRKSNFETAHCEIDIDDVAYLKLDSRHTNFELGTIGRLMIESRHDDFEIESVASLSAESQHTRYDIENVEKSIELDCSHGGASIDNLAAGFQEVTLFGSHADYRISVADNATYQLDASGTHAGISYPSDMDITYEKDKNNERAIRGRMGNSNSKGIHLIKARLSHGGVRVR